MLKRFGILSLTLISAIHFSAFSQAHETAKKQFDFWVGEWELTWVDPQRGPRKGKNSITREMNGKVIAEHFSDPSGNYAGASWSVYDTLARQWKQTWVDTQGAYLDLKGEFNNDRMVLQREFTRRDGQLVKQRMTFFNIEPNRFDWSWERSLDSGSTWTVMWKIEYKRTAK